MALFCCTIGRGLEKHSADEVARKLLINRNDIEVTEGKIVFTARPSLNILGLRMVEKVMVTVLRETPLQNNLTDDSLLDIIKKVVPDVVDAVRLLKEKFLGNFDAGKLICCETVQECSHLPQFKRFKHDRLNGEYKQPQIPESTQDDYALEIPALKNRSISKHSFRVSVKGTGKYRKLINLSKISEEGSKILVPELPDCVVVSGNGDPDFTVNLIVSEECLLIGVPIHTATLSKREYIQTLGLRPTVCSLMVYLAGITRHSLVVDPMCGGASLLIEAAHAHTDALYIGMDLSCQQLEVAKQNYSHFKKICPGKGFVSFLLANAARSPLLNSSVDIIITDMPFGKKHSSVYGIRNLYRKALTEFSRLLLVGGRAVILTSKLLSVTLLTLLDALSLQLIDKHDVSLGRVEATIVILRKT